MMQRPLAFSSGRRLVGYGLILAVLLLTGCRASSGPPASASPPAPAPSVPRPSASPTPPGDGLPVIVNATPSASFAHDPEDFTQGLLFADGLLYQSTGRNGQSKLQKLDPATGEAQKSQSLDKQYFGEGLASLGGSLYQLTWTSGVCLIYDLATLEPQRQLFYTSQGWGLTVDPDEKLFVFSDGSEQLRFLKPDNLISERMATVTDGKGQPVAMLNELEWVRGEVWANIWLTDRIARIDPKTGKVLGWILFTDLETENHRAEEDVLNGIAYDPKSDTLWITGKLWPKMYRFDGVEKTFFGPNPKSPSPSERSGSVVRHSE